MVNKIYSDPLGYLWTLVEITHDHIYVLKSTVSGGFTGVSVEFFDTHMRLEGTVH